MNNNFLYNIMPLNLISQTGAIEIKTEPYEPIGEFKIDKEILDPHDPHGAIVPEQYDESQLYVQLNELKNISENIKSLADLKSKELYGISPNPVRDILKEVILPAVGSGVGSTLGLVSGVLLHKLKIL